MRLFVGIPVEGATAEAVERVQDALPLGRVVPPENLHLTLAFLDDQPREVAQAVHEALSGLNVPGFALRLSGLEVKGGRQPRLIWAGVEGGETLAWLRDKVRGAVRSVGVELPRERFRPHVTLARFGRDLGPQGRARLGWFLEAQGAFATPPAPVERFCLFRSHLGQGGPVYEVLASYPVG